MSGTRRPASYTRHEEVRHGRYWRSSSPAIMSGLLHRSGGPAIELSNGDKEWWIDGECVAWQLGTAMEPLAWQLGTAMEPHFYAKTGYRSDISGLPGYAKGGDEP